MNICPKCTYESDTDRAHVFCNNCGTKMELKPTNRCTNPECKMSHEERRLDDEIKYCGFCGAVTTLEKQKQET